MKYNRSEIMKNAWAAYKSRDVYPLYDSHRRATFGDCLRQAWYAAKQAVKQATELASMAGKKFSQGMEITIDYVTYTLRRWTNYGKDRVYVSGGINNRMGRSNCYVDLQSSYSTVNNSQLVSIIRSLAY